LAVVRLEAHRDFAIEIHRTNTHVRAQDYLARRCTTGTRPCSSRRLCTAGSWKAIHRCDHENTEYGRCGSPTMSTADGTVGHVIRPCQHVDVPRAYVSAGTITCLVINVSSSAGTCNYRYCLQLGESWERPVNTEARGWHRLLGEEAPMLNADERRRDQQKIKPVQVLLPPGSQICTRESGVKSWSPSGFYA
jgi:hypothetical protein